MALFTHEHDEIRRTLKRLIDDEINPHVDRVGGGRDLSRHEVFRSSAPSACSA